MDWANDESDLGKFDLIIGSDLLYEDEHVLLLANFINNHANQHCDIILVDPDRGRKNKLDREMIAFGFISSYIKPEHTDYLKESYKGSILRFSR
ncbi:hypothetical protein [Methylophaga thalassica]|uniref:class I SAM-dependent methyltransferase n=1 Tax=Methylophaga thalassica TaxID=40223 RepID=UPI002E7AB868|nr:hypothetical protein [Methylophaga thalassica]WVI84621.1 hypothetical protein VSX76_12670 [Methylophaga thalassica]